MQRNFYNSTSHIMAVENHRGHDSNPDYKNILLKEVSNLGNGKALDFGCGIGRNIDNLLKLSSFDVVDGCDISQENIERSYEFLKSNHSTSRFNLFTTDGTSLSPILDNQYDFVMSTIVLQHIAVHQIRFSLLQDIYRVMKEGGLFSFQMAQYRSPHIKCAKYFDNAWDASGTNGSFDVTIDNPDDLVSDLSKIGFNNISYQIAPEWDANNQCYNNNDNWIYVKAYK